MKNDKILIGIVALIVILLLASFFISGDKKEKETLEENIENYVEVQEDEEEIEEEDTSTSTEESETPDTVSGSNDVLIPSTNTKPSITYTWKPLPEPTPVDNSSEVTEEVVVAPNFTGLEFARIHYTHDSKILIDVRDDADTPRLRYANINADPIAILSAMYGLSTSEVLEMTTITHKELDKENADLIGNIQAADSYVSAGNTLIAVQSENAKYYFWNDDSNVYTSAKEAARYMRKSMFKFWDKFFSN